MADRSDLTTTDSGLVVPAARGISRRRVVGTAAWAAPAIVVASAVPAFAASGDTISRNSPPASFTSGDYGWGPLSVTVRNSAGTAISGASVTYASDSPWLSFYSSSAVTGSGGIATAYIKYVSKPDDGAVANVTATYDTGSATGVVSIVWIVTYQPLTVAGRIAKGNAASTNLASYQVRGIVTGHATGSVTVDTDGSYVANQNTNFAIADAIPAGPTQSDGSLATSTNLYVELSTITSNTVNTTTPADNRTAHALPSTSRFHDTVDVTGDAVAYFSRNGARDGTSARPVQILLVSAGT